VLFPTLSRLAARHDLDGLRAASGNGVRMIALFLIPAAVGTAVLAEPLTRLVYQRGAFGATSTDDVSTALFWFSFSMPFSGANLMLTRTFFALQRPWLPTALAGLSLVINAGVSLALYKPFGIAGPVIGTAVASAAMTLGQVYRLRIELHGFEIVRTLRSVAQVLLAAALLGVVAYFGWKGLESALGVSLIAQFVSVTLALAVASVVYAGAVYALRMPEARQIAGIVQRRLRRGAS
jgi:putative peptidoglycan lipid II flippase